MRRMIIQYFFYGVTRMKSQTSRFLVSLLFLCTVLAWTNQQSHAMDAGPGDVNGNGTINLLDGALLQDHILMRATLDGDPLDRADANQDGKVDVADLISMQSMFAFPIIEMVSIPAGTFIMGARDDLDDGEYAGDDEYPRHEVTLSAYQIGKYQVTNGQYSKVLNYALSKGYLENSDGSPYGEGFVYHNGIALVDIDIVDEDSQILYVDGSFTWKNREGFSMENHPVVEITWDGCVAFCNWLSEMEGRTPAYDLSTWELVEQFGEGYRLPTEAEWERAAAWDTSPEGKHWIYGFMSDTLTGRNRCNYDTQYTTITESTVNPCGFTTRPKTCPVGWFNGININPNGNVQTIDSPSPVGCYDMSGNVWEWCHDWYDSNYYKGGAMTDPTGPASGPGRVLRGGAWFRWARYCRTATRANLPRGTPDSARSCMGFRVALSSPD